MSDWSSDVCSSDLGFRLALDSPGTLIRGGLIGTLIGAIPGVGSSVSNLVSYSETKRASRNPESFGKGNPQGVAASESANSSSEGGSMVSLFALGDRKSTRLNSSP